MDDAKLGRVQSYDAMNVEESFERKDAKAQRRRGFVITYRSALEPLAFVLHRRVNLCAFASLRENFLMRL